MFLGGLAVVLMLGIGANAASAQQVDPYSRQPPTTDPGQVAGGNVSAAPAATTRASSDALPVTGTDVLQLGLIGGGLVAAGVGLQTARRRRA